MKDNNDDHKSNRIILVTIWEKFPHSRFIVGGASLSKSEEYVCMSKFEYYPMICEILSSILFNSQIVQGFAKKSFVPPPARS